MSTGAFNIAHWLRDAAERFPDSPWLADGHKTVTFAQGWSQTQLLAGGLVIAGLQPADRVILLTDNRIETVLLFFATLLAAGTAVVLHPQTPPSGLKRIVEQTSPRFALLEQATASLASEFSDTKLLWADEPLSEALLDSEPLTVEHPAFLVFTSGSTSTPRGVMLMHDGVKFVSEAIQARLQYTSTDRIGVFLPLSFDVGLYQLFFSVMKGCSVFLGRPEMAGPELPRILATQAITVLPAVPTLLSGLIKMQRFRPVALPQLRILTSTGDHLPGSHIETLTQLFPHTAVFPMYGLTECKRVSIMLPSEIALKPGSVGRALDGTCVFSVDDEARPLPSGSKGELVITGPHLAAGYWAAPEETARRYREIDGVRALFSGDQGWVDEDGFIYVQGRADFVIKHRGFRLNPAEIEDAACAIHHITAAGCIKDETRDKLCLFITTDAEVDVKRLPEQLAQRLEPAKVPEHIQVVSELPRTANQKVDRKALRRLLEP
jgi:long-chain acyl-CoA synthetase